MSARALWDRLVGSGSASPAAKVPMSEADQTAYLAAVAHDLRTPVTTIYGYARILTQDHAHELSPDVRQILAVMERNARRMRILVEQILDVKLLEAGKIELNLAPVLVEAILEEAASEQDAEATRRSVALRLSVPDATPEIEADPDRVHQIAYNLLRNALRFAPDGSAVDLSARPEGDGVSFSIADRGPGVPSEFRDRIFDRFFRAPGQAQHSGTGIGLSIVKELAALHGGSVSCAENPGGGAVFTVRLPKRPPNYSRPVTFDPSGKRTV